FVELLPAKLVRHCDNQFKNRADFHRTLARWFAFCHFLPSLVLVRAPMGQPEPELLVLIDALLPHDITPKHSIRFSLVEPVGSINRLSLPTNTQPSSIWSRPGGWVGSPTEGLRLTCPGKALGGSRFNSRHGTDKMDRPDLFFGCDLSRGFTGRSGVRAGSPTWEAVGKSFGTG